VAIYNSFTGRGRKPRKQKPIQATLVPSPSRPPTGYYDPTIDHQVAAGKRGLDDLRIDIGTGKRRGAEDRDTTLADLLTAETRTRDDARLATENLGLQFQRLARGQAEGARVRGIVSGGLAEQAAGIRATNQGRAQATIDTSLTRAMEDIGTQRTNVGRAFDRQFGDGGDLDLTLIRGEREQPLLEADANELRLGQARAARYVPPMPYWKFTNPPKKRKPRRGFGEG
jgi:hypothetical protein